jgi:uroporphyrinogen-III decarboxylase
LERSYYINLANSGLRMPIGSDLTLHEKSNTDEILHDGILLGKVIEETARKYNSPLAVPLMDLMLEKSTMLGMLGIPEDKVNTYHFSEVPSEEIIKKVNDEAGKFLSKRMKADIDAVEYIAKNTDLIPVGMGIGPISLLTKLVSDPITIIYMASMGISAEEDPEVKMIETLLDISISVILKYLELKIKAGAKVIMIAEPAANIVYFSPKQIEAGSDIYERYVLKYNMMIKDMLDKYNVDLYFHCCGEITDYMLERFVKLHPVILSLGSSRILWKDAAIVPKDIVLYGNLPSKKFFSDDEITSDQVKQKSIDLIEKMKEVGHPFILGTECDVLHVHGCEEKIRNKVKAMMDF